MENERLDLVWRHVSGENNEKDDICSSMQDAKETNISTSSSSPPPHSSYRYWMAAQTRWNDNDPYGHINNSIYAFYFDSIVNEFLITKCGLDIHSPTKPRCLVVHSSAEFKKPISYPSPILIACSVARLGKSSITWSVAVFEAQKRYHENLQSDDTLNSTTNGNFNLLRCCDTPSVYGQMVHVYVDPTAGNSVEIPPHARKELKSILL